MSKKSSTFAAQNYNKKMTCANYEEKKCFFIAHNRIFTICM